MTYLRIVMWITIFALSGCYQILGFSEFEFETNDTATSTNGSDTETASESNINSDTVEPNTLSSLETGTSSDTHQKSAADTATDSDTRNNAVSPRESPSGTDSGIFPPSDTSTDLNTALDTSDDSDTERASSSSNISSDGIESDSLPPDTSHATDTDTNCDPSLCSSSPTCNTDGDAVCINACGSEMVIDECASPAGHGSCENGICGCEPGFSGDHCDICQETNNGVERCDGIDNNCDGTTDEGFNLTTDYTQCGGCDNDCRTEGRLWPDFSDTIPENVEMFACAQGVCQVESCIEGFGDDENTPHMDCTVSVTDLAAGNNHTCALLSNGTVKCWGSNTTGQLGANVGNHSATPVKVLDLGQARAVAAGAFHTCAILVDGSVYCWGSNETGQLGAGTPGEGEFSVFPLEVMGLSDDDVEEIALGGYDSTGHSCALLVEGAMKCWGINQWGTLGIDTLNEEYSVQPLQVPGLSNVQKISAGRDHTGAVMDNVAYCWGMNLAGELGPDSNGVNSTPVAVSSFDNVIEISLGAYFSCALLDESDERTIYCWGMNSMGQLGIDPQGYSEIPVLVTNLNNIDMFSSQVNHSCALREGGTTYCWGDNQRAQLGAVTESTNSYIPQEVQGASGAKMISVGYSHTCVLIENGIVKCWGHNAYGQLGNGETWDRNSYTVVTVDKLL